MVTQLLPQATKRDDGTDSNTTTKVAGAVAPMETAGVALDTLAAALAVKESELRALQKTHDEYVRSSCEYEKELELEIERCEKKTHAMEVHVQALEESKEQLQTALGQLQSELAAAARREQALTTQADEMKWKIQRLEQTNDELETATRVAQASIDELQHRVETLTEENIFLQQEKEALAEENIFLQQKEETRIQENTSLQLENERVVESVPDINDADTNAAASSSPRTPERRKTGRYPEVVECCLHMTCTNDQCRRHPQMFIMLPADQALATKTHGDKKVPTKRSFLERIRRLVARS